MSSLTPNGSHFLTHDGPAGFVVFLVALPLCLGVAHASGVPLFAGIIAGIVGGCLISLLSGSQVSVSGPAAGLVVIVAAAIQTLGSYEAFLAAVVICGVIQIGLGIGGAGAIGDYVPNSVIKGMLAGIGLVIVLKQIPHALGHDLDWIGDLSFWEPGNMNTLSAIFADAAPILGGPLVISVLKFDHPCRLGEPGVRSGPFFHGRAWLSGGRCPGNCLESSLSSRGSDTVYQRAATPRRPPGATIIRGSGQSVQRP